MDHYLGKEIVQNILPFRQFNPLFSGIWHRENIEKVEIVFKEKIGVEGRGHYFDGYGIVRDVMQNHLLQILTLLAMEYPEIESKLESKEKSQSESKKHRGLVENDSVRNAKVKVLSQMSPLALETVLLGQYTEAVLKNTLITCCQFIPTQ